MKTALLLLALVSLPSFAGDRGGNGGGVQVCPGSVELYDFYEGRHPLLGHLSYAPLDPALTVQDYLDRALALLAEAYLDLGRYAQIKLREIQAIPYDQLVLPISIPRTLDADIPFVDEGCEYALAANWEGRHDRLFISKALYERMDPRNQAGLLIHEVLYKIARDTAGTQDPSRVRRVVAQLFAGVRPHPTVLTNAILPQGAVVFLPREGVCHVRVDVQKANLGTQVTSLQVMPGNMLSLSQDFALEADIPCADILDNGLSFFIRVQGPTPFLRLRGTVNGRPFRDTDLLPAQERTLRILALQSQFLPLE